MKLKTLLSLCVPLLICGCDSDTTQLPKALPIDGYYKITSMTSGLPVDLDNNGIASKDMMSEIPEYFTNYPYDLYVRTIEHVNVSPMYQEHYVDFYLPHTDVNFDYPSTPEGYSEFARYGISYGYNYNGNDKEITIIRGEEAQELIDNVGRVDAVTIISEDRLEVILSKKYYDYTTSEWKSLVITIDYNKNVE